MSSYVYPFLIVFVCSLAAAFVPILRRLPEGIYRIARWIHFPENRDLDKEITRLELLRILTGLLLADRTYYTLKYLVYLNQPPYILTVSSLTLLASIMVAAGFLTPLAAVPLLVFHELVDVMLHTSTLGSDILQMLLFIIVFLPAGRRLSIDRLLMRQKTAARVLDVIYGVFGSPSYERTVVLRFLAFVAFGMVALHSSLAHLRDPAWIGGFANSQVLTGSYMSRFYGPIRAFFEAFPYLATLSQEFTIYGMLVWELVMIVFIGLGAVPILGPLARLAVVVWGLGFFLVSAIGLQLGWLAYYELVLWAAIFWQRWKVYPAETPALLLISGTCGRCTRWGKLLALADVFCALEIRALPGTEAPRAAPHAPGGEGGHLILIDPRTGTARRGAPAYLGAFGRVLLLWPLAPLAYVIGALHERRRAIGEPGASKQDALSPGVMPLGEMAGIRRAVPARAAGVYAGESHVFAAFALCFVVLWAVYILYLPFVRDTLPAGFIVGNYLSTAPKELGMTPLNVFNQTDLRLGENFFVVKRVRPDGRLELVPFIGPEGQRLKWHESDRVYFGNSLAWRRRKMKRDEKCFEDKTDRSSISQVVTIDRNITHKRVAAYQIEFYHQPLPDSKLLRQHQYRMDPPQLVCTVLLDWKKKKFQVVSRQGNPG